MLVSRNVKKPGRVGHGPTSNADPLAAMLAEKLSASRRNLPRAKRWATQTPGPIRNQRAVGRAGYGVFGHARPRREESRDEIAVATGRGGDDSQTIETHERGQVRLQISDSLLRLKDGEVVAGLGGGDRLGSKPCSQIRWRVAGGCRAGRKIERQNIFGAGDGQFP